MPCRRRSRPRRRRSAPRKRSIHTRRSRRSRRCGPYCAWYGWRPRPCTSNTARARAGARAMRRGSAPRRRGRSRSSRLRAWLESRNADAADALSLDRLHHEARSRGLEGLALARESPELCGDEAAQRVVRLGRLDLQPEGLAHVLERDASVHERLGLRNGEHELVLDVVFIADLADDLLDEVLDRHKAGGAAVFVDDDRDVDLVLLHLTKQRIHFLRLRDEDGRPQELAQRELTIAARDAAEDVLHVKDADDVVGGALVDGYTRVADGRDPVEQLLRRRLDVET